MKKNNLVPLFLASLFMVFGCKQELEQETEKVFEPVLSSNSGVTFSNELIPNDTLNYFNFGYYYMGAGVAIGDVNNDGLSDIYFTGNAVSNKLYLNQGDLKFVDVTDAAGVAGDSRWMNGVSMIDINADGLLDIYISVAGIWGNTENILYVNQGVNEKGVPQFAEEGKSRGLNDNGLSIQTCFLDYDQDGDIDVFVANYENSSFDTLIPEYKRKMEQPNQKSSDHLYQNDGNGYFKDVTKDAGVLNFGLAAGVIASDFNNDNLTDIYVSNDFNIPDYFYFNNGDGTFSEHIKKTTQHTVFYGMGVDAADINNDGLMDFVQMDMVPSDNFRSKANMASMDIDGFWQNVNAGFHYQYMYNVLQLNQGIRENNLPFYSDVAKMSGIDKTDWSWAPLFGDYNNDGLLDLYVTNGTRKDINNKDFFKWMGRLDIRMKIKTGELTFPELTEMLPSQKIDNYMFENLDGQNFEKANDKWGISFEGFSNGAAYADLDNDGDLELVVNNIDSAASIFKNFSVENGIGNFLKVQLIGSEKNPLGLGAKVYVTCGSKTYMREQFLVRGYESSIDPVIHFGLNTIDNIDKVTVVWPDGKKNHLSDVNPNQTLTMKASDAVSSESTSKSKKQVFELASLEGLTEYVNQENDFDDFDYQILLPHRMSRLGPAVANGDINQDGLEDLFIGGAMGIPSQMFVQQVDGSFTPSIFMSEDSIHEDVAAVFFDADNDQDLDLFVVSGGNDAEENSQVYKDRLYINNEGLFTKSETLPDYLVSGGVVLPFDFDSDGDMDLFIGGRQLPRKYPLPVPSYLLENKVESGELKFELVDQPAFNELGMVTDATWLKEGKLVVVGEWMPISIFTLDNGAFVNQTEDYGLSETVGWWNTVEKADFDQDGDEDLVVGNLGTNYKYQATPEETFDIYVDDYDANGNIDIVLGYYQDERQFPVRGMQCSSQQIPDISRKYKNKYNAFAQATLSDIYGDQHLENSLHYKVQDFSSVYMENLGNGDFGMNSLPFEAQTSSFNSMEIADFNGDGHLDILAGGNQFHSEIETPRNDACYGWLFEGNGKGGFSYVSYSQSGLYVPYDIRHIVRLASKDLYTTAFVSNSAPLVVYQESK
ncbi:MAG: VCBS repeat-containing protein [Reichenbachiella sp.]|uniref:VCBS repeat-containing protein n=1 Tax=Reichenbachiella sp. TaxID=2184521 RepID=UPI002965FF04|nr:VCBS repeat-containing protein [Reichenbachiella sp.]MDW3211394.1 VCBS repeat-containing protein [Reichenbachiella sp.]